MSRKLAAMVGRAELEAGVTSIITLTPMVACLLEWITCEGCRVTDMGVARIHRSGEWERETEPVDIGTLLHRRRALLVWVNNLHDHRVTGYVSVRVWIARPRSENVRGRR